MAMVMEAEWEEEQGGASRTRRTEAVPDSGNWSRPEPRETTVATGESTASVFEQRRGVRALHLILARARLEPVGARLGLAEVEPEVEPTHGPDGDPSPR